MNPDTWLRIGDQLINLAYVASITFQQGEQRGPEAIITLASVSGTHTLTFTGDAVEHLRRYGKEMIPHGIGEPAPLTGRTDPTDPAAQP